MIRGLYVWDKESQSMVLVDHTDWRDAPRESVAPVVRGDEIPPTVSHVTDEGKVFTSLSRLKRHYKAHGHEITGGDHLTMEKSGPCKPDINEIKDDVARARSDLMYNKVYVSEKERQQCREEERQYKAWKQRNWHLTTRRERRS